MLMIEEFEFRVDEELAGRLFADSEGEKRSVVRKVRLDATDPRMTRIGELQREFRERDGRPFYFGWDIRRRYSEKEIASASLFLLEITNRFEPAGEECGTVYDEGSACPICLSGARQLSPLILDTRRMPKGHEISATIAEEIVFSQRVANLLRREKITGIEFAPVMSRSGSAARSQDWYQPFIAYDSAQLCSPTRVGDEPFDETADSVACPRGDLAGLNLLSEVFIEKDSRGSDDILFTRQFVGVRRGLLRPSRLILVSPKVRAILVAAWVAGCRFDVVHLISKTSR